MNPSRRTSTSILGTTFDVQQQDFEEAARDLRYAGISRAESAGHGEIAYRVEVGERTITLAWTWAEIQPSVYAIDDPMRVESNVRLLDQSGLPLSLSSRAVVLNNAVRNLDWWAEIGKH